jgi:hypothetical protein
MIKIYLIGDKTNGFENTFDRSQVKVNEKDEFTTQMPTIEFPK